jgi:uncharacterized protein
MPNATGPPIRNAFSHGDRRMTILDDVVTTLRSRRSELERLGVVHAVVFGSVARGEERPDSDVDIAVTVDGYRVRSLFDHGNIQQFLEKSLSRPVDLARLDRLRPGIAREVAADGIHAF